MKKSIVELIQKHPRIFNPLLWTLLITVAVTVYAYFPSLTNRYVIADDIRIATYWFPQFYDTELFQDDLLTDYAKQHAAIGFTSLFYLAGFLFDHVLFGAWLAVFLVVITAYYIYKTVEYLTDSSYASFLGVLFFLSTSLYFGRMAGGIPRSFSYPLSAMFIYYLIRGFYWRTVLTLLLQCLFYPMIFLTCILTYALSFIKIDRDKIFDFNPARVKGFVAACLVCGLVIGSQYLLPDESVGRSYTRSEIEQMPEYYKKLGRWHMLPLNSSWRTAADNAALSNKIVNDLVKGADRLSSGTEIINRVLILGILVALLIFEILQGRLKFPRELVYLFLAGVVMYEIAAMLLVKLYVPDKYLRYTVSLLALMVTAIVIAQYFKRIPVKWLRVTLQIGVVAYLGLTFHLDRSHYFIDETRNKPLYEFLSTLPKDSMIAAHPKIADNIPLYAKRKVFISYEHSNPVYKTYWDKVKKRTFEFFHAYYSESPAEIYDFLQRNEIDYLVVNRFHFQDQFIRWKQFYIHPFNPYIVKLTEGDKSYLLNQIPPSFTIYRQGGVYVIPTTLLERMVRSIANQ